MSSPQSPLLRRTLGASAGVLAALALTAPGALAAPLAAETTTPAPAPSGSATSGSTAKAQAYRSWSFYHLKDGKWQYAETGPYSVVPPEGSVDGWRFATADMKTPRMPRATPTFEDICGKTAGEAGKKRVGVVVDYGRKVDAAEGANPPSAIARCAVVPSGASSSEVLTAVALPRDDKGMVCSIDNYPAGMGCAEPLATMPEPAKADDDKVDIAVSAAREQPKAQDAQAAEADAGPSKKVLTGVAVVIVALAGGAAYLVRRRKTA